MSSGRVVAIVQARMGSTRLPGKVLLPLAGEPVLFRLTERLNRVKGLDEVVVATSDLSENDPIRELGRKKGFRVFSGSETDVLDRFYRAALDQGADSVLRITADCPLADPHTIERVLQMGLRESLDYCAVGTGAGVATRQGFRRFPDGLDAELVQFSALETAWREARDPQHREHVTPYFYLNAKRFRVGFLECETDCSALRLTLDHPQDYELIGAIYAELFPRHPDFDLAAVLSWLKLNPDWARKNQTLAEKQNYKELWRESKK